MRSPTGLPRRSPKPEGRRRVLERKGYVKAKREDRRLSSKQLDEIERLREAE